MDRKIKYIIVYGHSYCCDLYSFARNKKEAKQHIIDCMEENGIPVDEVKCLEIRNMNIDSKTLISLS